MNRVSLFCVLALALLAGAAGAREPVFATPDQAYLVRAARALQDGSEQDAFYKFLKAARFGNKEAQKNVGLMYVKGLGVEKDWAKAYAWLHLAASHENPRFAAARNKIWAILREDEKQAANFYLRSILANYGDRIALERREAWVRKQKQAVSGPEEVDSMRVQVADATGHQWEFSGTEFFAVLDGYVEDLRQHMDEAEPGQFDVSGESVSQGGR